MDAFEDFFNSLDDGDYDSAEDLENMVNSVADTDRELAEFIAGELLPKVYRVIAEDEEMGAFVSRVSAIMAAMMLQAIGHEDNGREAQFWTFMFLFMAVAGQGKFMSSLLGSMIIGGYLMGHRDAHAVDPLVSIFPTDPNAAALAEEAFRAMESDKGMISSMMSNWDEVIEHLEEYDADADEGGNDGPDTEGN